MPKINEIDITSLTFQEGSAPTTPASTKWKIYTKTDGLYVIDDAGTETGPLSTGGASGNAPGWIQYLAARQTGETTHADDDFFDDDSLAGTAVTGGATVTWAEKYGKMSGFSTGSGGAFPSEPGARVFSLTPTSAPVTFETRVTSLFSTANNAPGVYVGFSDGATAGSNIAAVYIYKDGIYDAEGAFNSISASIWSNAVLPSATNGLIVRAVWTATNTFEYSFSMDGVQFSDFNQAADTVTLTPTHFFVAIADTSVLSAPVSFDYVRINTSDLSP